MKETRIASAVPLTDWKQEKYAKLSLSTYPFLLVWSRWMNYAGNIRH